MIRKELVVCKNCKKYKNIPAGFGDWCDHQRIDMTYANENTPRECLYYESK